MSLIAPPNQLPALNKFGHYLGSIVATTTPKDNSDTASSFTIPDGALVLIQPDVACYVSSQYASAAITAANSELMAANEKRTGFLWTGETKIAAKAVSGTVTLKVFLLSTRG